MRRARAQVERNSPQPLDNSVELDSHDQALDGNIAGVGAISHYHWQSEDERRYGITSVQYVCRCKGKKAF